MARPPRLVVSGEVHHLLQRTVEGTNAFPEASDLRSFVEALRRASREHGVSLHAYVLLPGEVQFLATPPTAASLSLMMQALARFYVPSFNRQHRRAGALWQGRFRAAPVGGDAYLLDCMRFIEQAPWRAGEAVAAADYPWSSAACHVGARADTLLSKVPARSAYWSLGNTPFEREAAYRDLLDSPLSADQLQRIESTTLKGWALGPGEFLASLALDSRQRAESRRPGRPRRVSDDNKASAN